MLGSLGVKTVLRKGLEGVDTNLEGVNTNLDRLPKVEMFW